MGASVVGWIAAFMLTLEKLEHAANPLKRASCDFSLLVQCSANLDSWQGAVFGFPNPLIGLSAWVCTFIMGVLLLAAVKLPKWVWWCFLAGVTAGLLFVAWLIGQSIYALGTLCPWCMATWLVMIPTAVFSWTYGLAQEQLLGSKVSEAAKRLYPWLPLLVIGLFTLVALLAQLRLDWLSYF